MTLPRVSVVLPVYNGAGEIGRALEALQALDWPADRLQILVVDNGSDDGTVEIVRRHAGIGLVSETEVQSSYAARNRGLAAADGDWIAYTDADCVAEPDWLRRLLLPEPPPDAGAVAGEVLALEATTTVQRLMERFGFMKHAVTLPHKRLPCFSTACVALRREVLQQLGGFRQDVRYFADMELSWRMQLETGRSLLFRPQAVVRHRHRRTWGELWRQGVQHGRGTAFMKRTYPQHYRIEMREQVSRLTGLGRSLLAALGLARPPAGACDDVVTNVACADAGGAVHCRIPGRDPDRWWIPLFLGLWYTGLLTGYLMGPARSHRRRSDGKRQMNEEP